VTRIVLVRHGETEWNAQRKHIGSTDLELNEKGKAQAKAVANALEEFSFTAVYSSTLKRCFQTAETIANSHNLKIKSDAGLNEIDFGEWEGLTWNDIKTGYPNLYRRWLREDRNFQMPGGERWQAFKERVFRVFKKILEENAEGTIAIVGHGGSLKVILCEILKFGSSCFFKFQLSPAAVSVFDLDGNKATLTLLNDTCHLPKELQSQLISFPVD